jgi:DNA-binding MarR family transcriptional regulator
VTENGPDPAGMKLAEIHRQPAHLVRRAHQIAVSLFLEECRDWGLTSIQYGILCVVDEAGALEQHVLADMLALDRSNISEVVIRLERRGLLERRAGVADRRTKCLYITDAGKTLLAEMTASVQEANDRMLAPLKPADRATFMELLARLVDINNAHSRAPMRRTPAAPE